MPNSAEMIQVQSTQQATQAPDLGKYTQLVRVIKETYTPEMEKKTEKHGFPIIRLDNWDAAYLAAVFRAHPTMQPAFTSLLIDAAGASTAAKRGEMPTDEQFAAVRAVKELAGTTPKDVNRFLTMIRDANRLIEGEKQKTDKLSFIPQELPAGTGKLLRSSGVRYDASAAPSLDAVVLAFKAHNTTQPAKEHLAVG